MRIERYAGQQPGVVGDRLAGPSNPSFDTNMAGWTVVGTLPTRSTTNFHSTPASARINVAPSGMYTDVAGTFKRGVAYRLTFYVSNDLPMVPSEVLRTLFGAGFDAAGAGGEKVEDLFSLPTGGSFFNTRQLLWVPKADYATARIWTSLPAIGPGNLIYLDDYAMEVVRPTIVDRRGFVRSKTHSMSQAINDAVGQQIDDTFLQTHKRAPLKGDLNVTGRGGVRRYLGDAAVDPAELLLYTGELIHLADQIDPDLGTIGRDGVIAAVTYNGDDETANVAIDNQRDNFEAAVERYQVVAGAGR